MTKWVYSFSAERAEGQGEMKNLLGGKGANLHEMASLGLPVPPGFTITTEVCTHFYANGKTYPDDLAPQVDAAMAEIGRHTGRTFGDAANPLLVSVRSGARASMPGMMDTVLNLGLNDASVETLAKTSNDARFAYDSYRRFIQMYSNVVLDVDVHNFEDILEHYKDGKGYALDTDLEAEDWRVIIDDYKAKVIEETGKPFPQAPRDQLWGAIGAVFSSWMNQRAITYRRLNTIPADWGTAVNVQAMVFGNMGETSATGVAFTRNPSTGENELYGEFLVNAQGEDVVAGIRTPQNITEAARKAAHSDQPSLESLMPEVFGQFVATTQLLEKHYRDMQDLEFTVERGKLWMLQTRNGKRTAKAALRCAVEMANDGLISREDAVSRIEPSALDQLLHPMLDPDSQAARDRDRPARFARRGQRRDRVFRRRGAGFASGRTEIDPGPGRDLAGRHPWHARRRGRRDHARGHDFARSGGCARHGQALRLGRQRDPHRLCRADHDRWRKDAQEGRRPHHRRRLGRSDGWRRAHDKARDDWRLRHDHDLGGFGEAHEGARQCGDRGGRTRPRARSAPKASASAAPSTCSSTASGSWRCAR